jgi:cell pole-organizing protein PopZ
MRAVGAAVSTVCLAALTAVAITAGLDVHAIRRARVDELAEIVKFREGFFSRVDTFGFRMDDFTNAMGTTNKVLADALVRMRAQVHEQTATSQRQVSATVQVATEATKQAAATSELVQQVADVPPPKPPVVQVQPAQVPFVNVQTPPTTAVQHTPAAQPVKPRPRARRRWFHLWLW